MELCCCRVMFIRENLPRYRIELSGVLLYVCTLPHWTQRSRSNKSVTRCHAHNMGYTIQVLLINSGAWSSPLKSARRPFDRQQKDEREG